MPTPDQPNDLDALAFQQGRDLAWCLESPELLKPQYITSTATVNYCPHYPSAKSDFFATPPVQPKKRLGLYFEQLWQQLVRQHFNQMVIAANQQITHAGTTLGAPDLLTYCEQQKTYVHYELAVKFYLESAPEGDTSAWIGPNSRDRLDLKLERLLNHQLPLARDTRAQAQINRWIADKGTPSLEQVGLSQQLILKGWLFQHYKSPASLAGSRFINNQCPMGHWLHFQELPHWLKHTHAENKHWLVLPRLYWLSPAIIHRSRAATLGFFESTKPLKLYLEQPILLNSFELKRLLQAQEHTQDAQALLIAEVELAENYWIELARTMWVNNYWPESKTLVARPSRSR